MDNIFLWTYIQYYLYDLGQKGPTYEERTKEEKENSSEEIVKTINNGSHERREYDHDYLITSLTI